MNSPPTVTVTGVTATTYEQGSEPTPACTVTDAEDTGEAATPATSPASGLHGLGTRTATCSYTDAGGLTATRTVTYSVVDTRLPTLTGAATTSPNAAGWCRDNVTIHWTAAGTGTGIDPATVPGDDIVSTKGQVNPARLCGGPGREHRHRDQRRRREHRQDRINSVCAWVLAAP